MHKVRVIAVVLCLLLAFVVSVGVRWTAPDPEPGAMKQAAREDARLPIRENKRTFEQWLKGRTAAAPKPGPGWSSLASSEADIAGGIELAKTRREWMAELIRTNPKAAIEAAVPMAVRAQLPASVLEHLEERVSGRGSYGVLIATDFEKGTSEIRREVVIDGKRYEAFVYGQRRAQVTQPNIPMHGVAVGNLLALAESSVRPLEAGEPLPLEAADQACLVSARPATTYGTAAFADVGGRIESFCGARHLELYAGQLAADQGSVGQAGEPPTAQESWSQGPKTCLFMRVNFPDDPTDPITEDGAYALMDSVNQFFVENSYDTTSIIPTVTPLLMMPQTKAYYSLQGTGRLMSDARQAAREAGYDTDNYHWDIVRNTSVPGFNFGGLAFVHGKGTWLQSSSVGVAAHELGHNYGLWHANSWNSVAESVYGIGTHSEYGNNFDTMGAASAGNNHFNAAFKHQLDWLPESFVHNVTANGTYRIYTYDLPNVVPGQKYAFRVKKNYDRNYWGEFRQKFTSNRWFNNGVLLNWDPWNNGVDQSEGGTHLLDTTPGSADGKNDCPVVIGRTFSDLAAGVHITPLGRSPGGEAPWIDVAIHLGFYPGNRSPVATLIADRATAPANLAVNFFVQAVDEDGDTLAYAWDFGDATFGPNQPNVSKGWATAGEYTVRCTVSDMKGGVYAKHTLIRVGNPTTTRRASGRVLTPEGAPVESVRVHNGSTGTGYRGVFTDSDGYYLLPNLGSGTVNLSAAKYGYTLAQSGWSNPMGAGTNVSGLDWVATPLPMVSIVAADASAAEAGLSTGDFLISRTGPTNEALIVKLNRSGSAASGSDYTNNPPIAGSPLAITIPVGRDSIQVRVHPMPDSVGEGVELATFTLMEDATYVMGQAEASVTIADDDPAGIPAIDVSASTPSELADNLASETGPDSGVFTFTRNGSTANEITVFYSVTGTATAGVDFTGLPGVVIIPAGERVTSVLFTVLDDLLIEPDETVTVTILANAAYSGAGDNTTVTLVDDDPPRITITATDDVGREAGASPAAFTITRQGNLDANLVVNYIIGGTALSGEDYVDLPGTITILAGRATATLTVTPINDGDLEGEETVQVAIASAPSYNVGNPGIATVTLVDDEAASVTVSASDASAAEAGAATGAFLFTRTGPTTDHLVVFYNALGTALNGIDYQNVGTSITIPAGAASATLTIVPIDDTFVEGAEAVRLVLLPSNNYSLGTTAPQTVTIADDDSGLPSVGFTFPDSSGSEGATPARISLTLGASASSTVTVNYSVTGGTATGGNVDFNLAAGTATFPAGIVNTNIAVAITSDTLIETNETIRITLSSPNGAVLNTALASHIYTIIDDDAYGAIGVALSDGTASETGPDPGMFRISRTSTLTNDLTVYYQVVGSASAPSDFASLPGFVVIPAGTNAGYILIDPVDDDTEELDETVIINLLSAPHYRIGTETATLTIVDNDDSSGLPVVSIAADDAAASEPGADTGVFRITRTGDTTDALTVQFTVGGTANAADFPSLGTAKTILAGESEAFLVVTPNDDALFETNETVVVTLTHLSTYKVGTPAATVTIIDNEIGVSIAAEGTLSEEGSPGSFVLTRTGSTAADLSVNVSVAGTATIGSDYTGLGSPVVIPAGSAQMTVPLTAVNDPHPEGPETITVTLAAGAGYTVTQPNNATLLLLDDEPGVSIVATDPEAGEGGGNNGRFRITRSGNTNAALAVSLAIGGTAGNGVDYAALSTSANIPAGQAAVDIDVIAIDDLETDGNETVELTLLPDATYAITPPNTALVTIIDDEINLVPTVTITSPDGDTIYLQNTNSMLVLEAIVSDDGRPNPPGQTAVAWTRASGTGLVTFGSAFQAATTAAFSANGVYVLRITADDSQFTGSDEVTVIVGGQAGLDAGLLAYWKFDETAGGTALDSTLNNRHATVTGAAIVPGRYGNARDFDGLDDNASFTSPALTRFTVTAWVQSDTRGESTTPRIIAMPGYNVRVRRDTGSTFDCLAMESQRSTTTGEWRTPQSTIVDGPWHHIAVIYDSASTANNPVFFINGVLQPTTVRTAPSGTQTANNGTGYIGNSAAGDRTYDGRIDEMRLYNRLLSSNEVALLAAEPPTNIAPVVDAGPAQIVPVATPVTLNGTITDDGNVTPVVAAWSKVSGPGEVVFTDPSDPDDTAVFNAPGAYVLQLLADDGQIKMVDHVSIQVTGPTTVNLVAADAEAGELPGSDEGNGTLMLVRSGDLFAPITVYLNYAGTASNGMDYITLPTAIFMPAGQTNRLIPVQPRVDGLPEGTETLLASLLEDPAYNLGSSTNASLLLFDQPYDDWRYAHFTAVELLDADISGHAADPDGDGINNFLEYAFFRDPKNLSTMPSLDPSIESGSFHVAYHRRKAPTDVIYQIERSNDLAAWTASQLIISVTDDGNGITETVKDRDLIAYPAASGQRFVRLRVRLAVSPP